MNEKEEKLFEMRKNVNRNEQTFQRKKSNPIHDKFKEKIAATDKNFVAPTVLFNGLVMAAPLTRFKPTEKLVKKIGKLGGTHNSKGLVIPVNVDMSEQTQIIHPPIELVKEAIRKSTYRVILNKCACRTIEKCEDYPIDIGCMFLGKAAKSCVDHGSGHEATVEECLEHVDRALAAGLSCGTYWLELEQYAWGFQDADLSDFVAFCFCCPCCCHEIKFQNLAGGELKHILNQSIGWHCEPIEYKCVRCGNCINYCPRHFLKKEKGKIVVDPSCAGCGLCIEHCPQGALHVVQHEETKEHLQEYFEKLNAKW